MRNSWCAIKTKVFFYSVWKRSDAQLASGIFPHKFPSYVCRVVGLPLNKKNVPSYDFFQALVFTQNGFRNIHKSMPIWRDLQRWINVIQLVYQIDWSVFYFSFRSYKKVFPPHSTYEMNQLSKYPLGFVCTTMIIFAKANHIYPEKMFWYSGCRRNIFDVDILNAFIFSTQCKAKPDWARTIIKCLLWHKM